MSKNAKRLIRTLICLAVFIPTVICKVILKNADDLIWLGCFSLIYLSASYDVLFKAVRNICRGKVFDENFLMTVASLGALVLGEYVEACAVILFYQVGECFQSYAVGKSRKSITALMDIRPDLARVLRDGNEEIVEPDEVSLGEIIVVKAGDKIPLDGEVIKGNCNLNVMALTGESKPLEVGVGDKVLSGTVCMDGQLYIKTEKEFYDSTVYKILDMVENASGKKAKVESFISVFSKYYTPIVVISALLLAIIPSIITFNWQVWTIRALTFLVVSCPCALVISVPLGFFGGIGGIGKRGVLIKGANYVERLAKANVFVLDKTGTLTKGEFSVVGVYPKEKREDILRYAYICESSSNHPLSKSIVKECKPFEFSGYEIREIAGKGIVASKNGEVILCGNESLLKDNGVSINYEKTQADLSKTLVYTSINGVFLGVIVLSDTVREDATVAIESLKKSGAKIYMLTGDGKESAKAVANTVGIENYYSNLLPQDKMEKLEEIISRKNKNDVVCFVGDGINDAPAIMRADVGVSMGGIGTDSAIEASDAVLMHDNLTSLISAKRHCKKTMAIVRQNIVFALAVKFSALILSAFGIGGMWYAVFADVGVSVLAILNSIRTLK
ncbi:MAG: heavy metal translocating P-type ATPase [Clostridia bacterium]|nr:heavy metal translocating P-type ATPase [Clostridia bacterium]